MYSTTAATLRGGFVCVENPGIPSESQIVGNSGTNQEKLVITPDT